MLGILPRWIDSSPKPRVGLSIPRRRRVAIVSTALRFQHAPRLQQEAPRPEKESSWNGTRGKPQCHTMSHPESMPSSSDSRPPERRPLPWWYLPILAGLAALAYLAPQLLPEPWRCYLVQFILGRAAC